MGLLLRIGPNPFNGTVVWVYGTEFPWDWGKCISESGIIWLCGGGDTGTDTDTDVSMNVCLDVCVALRRASFARAHIHTQTHTYTHTHAHTRTHMHACVTLRHANSARACTHTHTHACARVHRNTHTQTHTHTQTQTQTHIHTHIACVAIRPTIPCASRLTSVIVYLVKYRYVYSINIDMYTPRASRLTLSIHIYSIHIHM